MGYPIVGDFEESAQELAVRFNRQQPLSLQGSITNSPSQSTVAPDFHTVFPHEPTPSTWTTQIVSTGRTVKAASRCPLLPILEQNTSDAGSTGPGSAETTTFYVCKTEVEKKTGVQSTDEGKKLTCFRSLWMKHNMQRKENCKKKPLFVRKSRLLKSWWSQEEMKWNHQFRYQAGFLRVRRKVRMKLMSNIYTVHVCCLKTATVKNGFSAKNV